MFVVVSQVGGRQMARLARGYDVHASQRSGGATFFRKLARWLIELFAVFGLARYIADPDGHFRHFTLNKTYQ